MDLRKSMCDVVNKVVFGLACVKLGWAGTELSWPRNS